MKSNFKIKALWGAIIFCFILMATPPVIIYLDKNALAFMHIPLIYVYIFILWIIICILTFIGYKLKWGDKKNDKNNHHQ